MTGNFSIFYQNVRGLNTKIDEFYCNLTGLDFNIICLTETWLGDSISNDLLFPPHYSVFRSDRNTATSNKSRGGGVLTAIPNPKPGTIRRPDLEQTDECLWIEIPCSDGFNLLIGNHYFPPDTCVLAIKNYFNFLENNIDSSKFRTLLIGDFNVPGFNWETGSCIPNTPYYSKIKALDIYTTMSILNFSQVNFSLQPKKLLDLVFCNFLDVDVNISDISLVPEDPLHPSLLIQFTLPITFYKHPAHSYWNYAKGNYPLLYDILSARDWSEIYNLEDVDTAADLLNNIVCNAINTSIPYTIKTKSYYPSWFSSNLIKKSKQKSAIIDYIRDLIMC